MRISDATRQTIVKTAQEIFGDNAEVLLFGSRVDDHARGGDIDLLVRSDEVIPERERKVLALVARLQRRLGDQPIDVLVIDPQTKPMPIHEEALATGLRL